MKKHRLVSIVTSIALVILMISGCSSSAIETAKQIESRMQEREAKANSFNNINVADINEQNAMNIIKELTSEKYKGRKAGTEGNEAAQAYVADQFRAIGLKNPDGLENYMQFYNQSVILLKETPKLEILDGSGNIQKSFEYPKNFTFRGLSSSTEDINIKAPMEVMKSNKDLSEKSFRSNEVLLFSIKEGQDGKLMYTLVSEIYDTKASAIIVEQDLKSENRRYSQLLVSSWGSRGLGEMKKPVITVDSATYKELAQAASENKTISLQCHYKVKNSAKTANLVGYIPGGDEKLKDDYIIISGHLDHAGDNLNGTYNPGALDNASGSAAMIEIARVLAEGSIKPKKTIVFIDFNGEEDGMIGSEYYAGNPVFPLKNAVMINLDMVGSAAKVPLGLAGEEGKASNLKFEILEMAETLGVDAAISNITGGDHVDLGKKGVPAVMLIHADLKSGYHSPDDTIEDIDSKRLRQVIELVLYYIDKKAY